MNKKVAVIGAGGFLGAFWLRYSTHPGLDLVPVVRTERGFAQLLNATAFENVRMAANQQAVREAIRDATAVVDLSGTSDHRDAVATLDEVYEACQQENIPILIKLSSAAIFGDSNKAPVDGAFRSRSAHWNPYAAAKIAMEQRLGQLSGSKVKIACLRPGLIWGPASPWTALPARELLGQRAWFVDDGKNSCNLIYVRNLLSLIEKCVRQGPPSGDVFFNCGDPAPLSWRAYYESIAKAIGVTGTDYRNYSSSPLVKPWMQGMELAAGLGFLNRLKMRLSTAQKGKLKMLLRSLRAGRFPAQGQSRAPKISREHWELKTKKERPPCERMAEFGGEELLGFDQCIEETRSWLRFAGYMRTGNVTTPWEWLSAAE